MDNSAVFAKADLELRGSVGSLQVRVFSPEWDETRGAWACQVEIDPPISMRQSVYGESGIQALSLALKVLASTLYGSSAYKERRLGAFGAFGGYLGFPAPKEFLSNAPYPF